VRRRLLVASLAGALTLIGAITLAHAAGASEALPSAFRVTWQRRAYSVAGGFEGRVENDTPYRVSSVRLRIEGLDEGEHRVGETSTWVFGSIPARGLGFFVFTGIPRAVTYRISVISFDRVAREEPQSP
jgi:hypothetical protein